MNKKKFPRVSGLAIAAGCLSSAFTVLGFLGNFNWALDILANFRVQYFTVLTASVIFFLFVRKPKIALIFAGFATVNIALILPLFLGGQFIPNSSDLVVRALHLNLHVENREFGLVKRLIEKAKPDLVLLVEVNSYWKIKLESFMKDYQYKMIVPRPDNFGIAIFSKFPLKNLQVISSDASDIPAIWGEVELNHQSLVIVGLHPAPPIGPSMAEKRNSYLRRISGILASETRATLVLGDLNMTPWSTMFRTFRETSRLEDCTVGRGW